MIKLASSILLILSFSLVSAQDSSSVLFLGNSYTAFNNLPQLFKSITESLGDAVFVDSRTPGGTTFQGHASNGATYQKIQSNPWHFVVLQAQSQEPSFPDAQVNVNTLPYAQQLADSVYANQYCSQVLFYMTWGRKNGDAQWAPISTYEGMQSRLRNAYLRFADSTQAAVSPVGMAWKYVRENHPTIELYTADESHPSYAGSYLAACTFYASIFRKTPVGATFTGSLNAQTAQILQQAAAVAVLHPDSLAMFYLRENPTTANFDVLTNGTQAQITNTSWRATDYLFDFGDGTSSTDIHPLHNYSTTGVYTISLQASSVCNASTATKETSVVLGLEEENNTWVVKTKTDHFYEIENVTSIGNWKVRNEIGQVVLIGVTQDKRIDVDLSGMKSGMYTFSSSQFEYKLIRY